MEPTVDDIIVPTATEHDWASYQAELWSMEFIKSQMDMFGGETPEVPKIEAPQIKEVSKEPTVKSGRNPNHPVLKDTALYKPEEIMENLALHRPELSDLMKEGIDTHKKLKEIVGKAGGYRGHGDYSDPFPPMDLHPFPYRLYTQYVSSHRATEGKREEALNKFKDQLKTAKDYLANPHSDEELAKIKEGREAKSRAETEAGQKSRDEAIERYKAKDLEDKDLFDVHNKNIDFIKTIHPSAEKLEPRLEHPFPHSHGNTDIAKMISSGIPKDGISLSKKIHDRLSVYGSPVKPTDFVRFTNAFKGNFNFDPEKLTSALKERIAQKGNLFESNKMENLASDILKIASEHKAGGLQKAQLDMFGGEAPEVPDIPANPSADRMNNLSVEHKQIFNNLTKKQKNNSITSPERTHLTRFNQYLKGDISHDQLKNYVAYKQNEHHTPLFQNTEVPKIDMPAPPTVDNVEAPEKTEEQAVPTHPAFKGLLDHHNEESEYSRTNRPEEYEKNKDFYKNRSAGSYASKFAGDGNKEFRQKLMHSVKGGAKPPPLSQSKVSDLKEVFMDWLVKHGDMKKSQLNMFEDEPKVDKVEAPKVADVKAPTEENFIKPEHKLTSEDGTWKIKDDPTATAKMHSWLKDKYNKKEIYTYGGLMQSGHPLADKIKELHGDNNGEIFDHFNKATGRESGKPAGVGENQLRMSMKDGGGLPIGDKHFQVPDLSKEAKIERDSYPNGTALHQALNNEEVSPELYKWHKNYKFNSHHTNKATISEDNPLGNKYERTLYNRDTGNFGKIKQSKEDNLMPKDLEKYNSMKEKFAGSEFNDDNKARYNELKDKANKTYPLSDKFSPEDKEKHNAIGQEKERLNLIIADKTKELDDPNRDRSRTKGLIQSEIDKLKMDYDNQSSQEAELHNDYREKLGLHKGDQTGEKGFSYKQDLEPDEKAELEDLEARKNYSRLDKQYNQSPEEHHISKLLKFPMSSNQQIFDGEDNEEEPEQKLEEKAKVPEKMDLSEKVNAPKAKKEKAPEVPQISIEDHFPTVGIRNAGSLQKTAREYGHRPDDSEKEYQPNSNVDFNGSKYSIQSDGGTYVLAKNLATGETNSIAKNDLENYPTDKKIPVVYKNTVEDFMNQHGEKGMSLEDVYSGMGFPDDIKGKDHIKKKLKMALLQLEHNHESEEGHVPIVDREIGKPHPKEKDPRERGIMYKLAKSISNFATQNRLYIKGRNLIKSLMIELYPKERNIYEKSIESLDILHSLAELQDREKSLSNWLDNIQATSIMKSGSRLLDISCAGLDETTNDLSSIQSRFELLKSMDDGSFQKFVDEAVQAGEEEESRATYSLSKSYMQTEQYKNKLEEIENGKE